MREILFRGKTYGGEWVYGSLVHRTMFYGDPCDDYVILSDGEFHCDYYDDSEVIPETVGQFTGVIDKKGVKIFEGDIVNGFDALGFPKGFGVVTWDTIFSGWRFGKDTLYGSKYISKYEVVGNINDNPELLEV